jgi:hypothetical protein
MSHDWPRGIEHYGNINELLSTKPFLKQDIDNQMLGSPASMHLLSLLKPQYWFSAHMHVQYPAVVDHQDGRFTKFMALDKCLPNRGFVQFVALQNSDPNPKLSMDVDWLCLLKKIDHVETNVNANGLDPILITDNDREELASMNLNITDDDICKEEPQTYTDVFLHPHTKSFCERFGLNASKYQKQ